MEIINKYFKNLSLLQTQQFEQLHEFYSDWNDKINVISRKDIDNLYERHVLHSLSIAKYIHFVSGSRIVDVGTGGGFPGIPLAIMFPDTEFLMIDSIKKKITVVQNAIKLLGLGNASAKPIRSNELQYKFDFVVSRAVSQMPKFVSDVKHLVSNRNKNALPNGLICLKGGDLQGELAEFSRIELFSLHDFFDEDFFETKKLVYLPFPVI